MSALFDTDILVWPDDQAIVLRPPAAGERVNGLVDGANAVEEIESAGHEPLYAVRSWLGPSCPTLPSGYPRSADELLGNEGDAP